MAMQSMKLINLSSSDESDDSPPAIPKFNPGPKSNASGPKSLAMASMMQTIMDSSSSDSESEMRPGPNASKLQMNETVSPVKMTDGPTKPSYTGPMSMSSKLNTMMDSSSDSDSGDEIAVVTSSTAPTTVESTIPTKTQDAPAGIISGPASLASRLNDISDSDSSSDGEIIQAKPSIERSIPTKTSDAPQSGVMTGPASLASRLNDISSSSSEDEGHEIRTTSLQPPSAQISMPSNVKQFSSSSSEGEEELAAVPLQGNSAAIDGFRRTPKRRIIWR
ncbi:unnamed protein product [Oikopleura dioica]|uniref:Uncharacterized protein n=1 Tax=Oikopleura dioica TaxID=34765 RepID=E4YN02_OIKDI|nr:unnamed protein product [Oikopleura dioica]